MVILIFLFACVYALLHFIWEGILAPSLRHNIRLDLFALRDNLRRLKINNPELPNDAFNTVQDGLNGAIKHLSDIDIPLLVYCDSIVKRDADISDFTEPDPFLFADGAQGLHFVEDARVDAGKAQFARARLGDVAAFACDQ